MIRLFILLSILLSHIAFAQATKTKTPTELHDDLQKINKSIDETKKKMKTLTDTRFLPETYFILAELLIKKSKYIYSINQIENSDLIEKINYPAEKQLKEEAIAIYNKFINKFPKSLLQDKALFFIAHEYRELGQHQKMLETYQNLVNTYPKSKYWAESQLTIANHIYNTKKDFSLALNLYQKIIDRPTSPFTSFAHYKSGWCYIHKNKWKESLLSFEKAIQKGSATDSLNLSKIYRKTDVRRNALLAIVWPYSELKLKELKRMGAQYTDPITYFQSLSTDLTSYKKVLRKLSKRLLVKKQFTTAVHVHMESLKLSKDLDIRIKTLESLYVAIKNTEKRWPVNGLISEISKIVHQIKYSSQLDKEKKEYYLKRFEIFSRDNAIRFQERAKSTQRKLDYRLAIKAYESYLNSFPKSKYIPSIKLNLAECYYNIGDFINAAIHYEHLGMSSNFSQNRKKKILDSAIQSYTEALKNSKNLDRLQIIQVRSGIRTIGWHYIKKYKKNPIVPEILFNIGRTYYDERNFNKSTQWLSQYIKYFPKHKDVSLAVDLILDSHNQIEDYDGLIESGKAIAKNNSIKKYIRKNALEIMKQAQYKKVQIAAGKYSSPHYIKNLLKLSSKYKNSNIEINALYEAFLKSKKSLKTTYAYGEKLFSKYKNSKYTKNVIFQMGEIALKTADFKRAAKYFEIFAKKYPKDSKAQNLMENANHIREFLKDFKSARQNFQYLKNKISIARIDYLAEDWSSLKKSALSVPGTQGVYWKGLATYHTEGPEAAHSILNSITNKTTDNYEENAMAAHSLYLLSMPLKNKYKNIKIKQSHKKQIIQEKTKLLEQLTSQFIAITKLGVGEWTIASLYELGHIYQEFAQFLRTTPVPKKLTKTQVNEYRKAIHKQTKKYNLEANNYFKRCTVNAEKSEIFTPFAKGCILKKQIKIDESTNLTNRRKSKKYLENIENLHQKLYENPENINLLIKLAQEHVKNKSYLMAILTLHHASEIHPQEAKLIALQGMYYLYLNDFESAKLKFNSALKKSPKDPTALWGLMGLFNAFHYKSKVSSLQKKISKTEQPLGPIHKFVKYVM